MSSWEHPTAVRSCLQRVGGGGGVDWKENESKPKLAAQFCKAVML